MGPQPAEMDPHFTVFIRLPFPRGDFVDPPAVEWTVSKDHALWDILSRPPKGNDIDWKGLAEHFDVTLPFLLQQAAWLYDRQLSQVRAQIRKVGNPHSAANSPVPQSMSGSGAIGGQPMKRVGSGASRDLSKLSIRQKEGQSGKQDPSAPATPIHSKAPLYPTVSPMNPPIQAMGIRSQSPRQAALVYADSTGRNQQSLRKEARTVSSPLTSPPLEQDISPASSSSSSSSDSGAEETTRRGPPFARFGRFSVHRGSNSIDEDEEDSPAFLPLTTHHKSSIQQAGHDPSATLRQEPELPGHPHAGSADTTIPLIKTSATEFSASSGSSEPASSAVSNERPRPTGHPINPNRRRTAELARLSPRRRATGREGSDGTPSMGSSFSDLDDASLTQSALEEALLSTMQRGGVASRMSTISQALKSRYL
ncbi:conserved hypothetical protein [Histoplasma capsulatum H143]|uniref:Autophagy-related protein 29 n=1 Tax=Ajellomyces capsulatus (strain H143) TaxID=544712 RepID=C6H413_AJECH|nr:conserved hypothetical protein [Histoplasma capsulatum H143]